MWQQHAVRSSSTPSPFIVYFCPGHKSQPSQCMGHLDYCQPPMTEEKDDFFHGGLHAFFRRLSGIRLQSLPFLVFISLFYRAASSHRISENISFISLTICQILKGLNNQWLDQDQDISDNGFDEARRAQPNTAVPLFPLIPYDFSNSSQSVEPEGGGNMLQTRALL